MPIITDEQLETLGQDIVDRAANYLEYRTMGVPDKMKIDALLHGLSDIKKTAKDLFVAIAGENPWQYEDEDG